ncbi:MAG TPA: beta-galactosidase [Bacteroidota bacterium]|nr:beta-galactosidase [Bacteroidota bacterium]
MNSLRSLFNLFIALLFAITVLPAKISAQEQTNHRLFVNSIKDLSGQFQNEKLFREYIDSMKTYGITTLRVWGHWGMKCVACAPSLIDIKTEPSPGKFDFSLYFKRLDYAIDSAGMDLILCMNFAGKFDYDSLNSGPQAVLPPFIGPDDIMFYRNNQGKDLMFSTTNNRQIKIPRFEKPAVRTLMLDYVSDVVREFRSRYGNKILFYSFTFTQSDENEYPLLGTPQFCDVSSDALDGFRQWLKLQYGKPERVSDAWGRSSRFNDYSEIQILDGQPPPPRGKAPQAYLDFMAYREWALAGFMGEIRDRVHEGGGRVMAQYGSAWDAASATRGTYGFGRQVKGFDLIVIDDDPTYDHNFSMDYIRANAGGIAFGSELEPPCWLGCEKTIDICCDATKFPLEVNIPLGMKQMDSQVLSTYRWGGSWVDLANWDAYFKKAFPLYRASLRNALVLSADSISRVIPSATMELSLKELYIHHHDKDYLSDILRRYNDMGGGKQPISIVIKYDL